MYQEIHPYIYINTNCFWASLLVGTKEVFLGYRRRVGPIQRDIHDVWQGELAAWFFSYMHCCLFRNVYLTHMLIDLGWGWNSVNKGIGSSDALLRWDLMERFSKRRNILRAICDDIWLKQTICVKLEVIIFVISWLHLTDNVRWQCGSWWKDL